MHSDDYSSIIFSHKLEKIECLIDFDKFVSGPGGFVKKIHENELNVEYYTEYNPGKNASKIIYSFYMRCARLIDYVVFDEVIEGKFVTFKLMKNNS